MTRLRNLLDVPKIAGPAGPDMADRGFSDAQTSLTRAEFAALVAGIQDRIAQSGLSARRICLPIDSTLGAFAALIAVLETDASAALMARPAEDAPPEWPGFCDLLLIPPDAAAGPDTLQLVPLAGTGAPPAAGEDRVYLRTSGTTGTQKWVVHSKERLVRNGEACITRLGLAPEDRVLIPVPFHHMFGLGAGLLPSLMAGASICLVPRGNPLEVFKAQRNFAPTVVFLVPSQCRSIMALNRATEPARLNVVAGDKLAPDEAAAFEARYGQMVCLYGSTELGAITAGRPGDPAGLRHQTAGAPMDGVTLALEPSTLEGAAEGEMQMRVRHPAGLLGYADAQGEIIAPAPEIWATGDLVRLHPGDRVEVLGRADHAVNRDGLLVHMDVIEASLIRAEGVALAAVVAAGQTRRGAGLAAFCTLKRPGSTTDEAILQHCREALPPRAVPDWLVILDALPMLGSGKVDRRGLVAEAESRLKR